MAGDPRVGRSAGGAPALARGAHRVLRRLPARSRTATRGSARVRARPLRRHARGLSPARMATGLREGDRARCARRQGHDGHHAQLHQDGAGLHLDARDGGTGHGSRPPPGAARPRDPGASRGAGRNGRRLARPPRDLLGRGPRQGRAHLPGPARPPRGVRGAAGSARPRCTAARGASRSTGRAAPWVSADAWRTARRSTGLGPCGHDARRARARGRARRARRRRP